MITHVVGIDYSITSPACCAINLKEDEFAFDKVKFLSICTNKRLKEHPQINHIQNMRVDAPDIDRFTFIRRIVLGWLSSFPRVDVMIEDYSFGSTGRVFHIAENCGILKHGLTINGIHHQVVSPSVVKKFATGKGNADKNMMYEQFIKDTGVDLLEVLGEERRGKKKMLPSPITDLVDAFYICKYNWSMKKREEDDS